MRTGPAFNRRVVVGGFGEQGLTTVPHGYRINVYLRVEHNAIFVKNGAAPPILSELISANAWLVAAEDTTRCLRVAQDISNFCKGWSSGLAEVRYVLGDPEAARCVYHDHQPRVRRDQLA